MLSRRRKSPIRDSEMKRSRSRSLRFWKKKSTNKTGYKNHPKAYKFDEPTKEEANEAEGEFSSLNLNQSSDTFLNSSSDSIMNYSSCYDNRMIIPESTEEGNPVPSDTEDTERALPKQLQVLHEMPTSSLAPNPSTKKINPSPTEWERTNHEKNKICMAKLHSLAREHVSDEAKEQHFSDMKKASVLGTEGKPTSNHQSKSDRKRPQQHQSNKLNGRFIEAVLGTSETACGVQNETAQVIKTYASKPTSPASVISMSSLKNGLKGVAQSSMNTLFHCGSSLKDVECQSTFQDGFGELKEDFYHSYKDIQKARNARRRGKAFYNKYGEFNTSRVNNNDVDEIPSRLNMQKNTSVDNDSVAGCGNSLIDETTPPRASDRFQPRYIDHTGITTIRSIDSGDIPMVTRKNPRSEIQRQRQVATPATRNDIPWDERSSSEVGLGNGFVSRRDARNWARRI